ncbi:type II toxin-antitoxin system CcdA family antitoxin [Inquilinus sp. CAU 1745]|uniref:type II toxin-antitoxin system CcdA family antitoxin n=1 Tax=Inquilinus sp. CAU 1745 TaxID=3140369 RepID=UPI00325A50E1
MGRSTMGPPKRAANVSISRELLDEARKLRVNVSQAAEQGLSRAVAERRAEAWLEENRDALESSNQYVEKNGLPLAKYRQF